jgi:hypothetical protein
MVAGNWPAIIFSKSVGISYASVVGVSKISRIGAGGPISGPVCSASRFGYSSQGGHQWARALIVMGTILI